MEQHIIAIDLGTTKVVTLVGRRSPDGKVHVLASSETPSQGILRGEVLNIAQVVESTQRTLDEVRRKTNVDCKEVYVGIAGQHIRCFDNRATDLREVNDVEISEYEIKKLEDRMYQTHVEPGEVILHVIPQSYNVDGNQGITNPVGMPGKQLEANYRIFVGKELSAKYTNRCIERIGLSLKQLILEPLASAQAVLSDDEKELGVAMVDIGGGTTDLIVYYDNIIRHSAVIPFGGNVITTDIRHGCGILARQANAIKEQYGSCFSELVDDTVLVVPNVNGQEHEISFKFLAEIIEARMEEILEAVMYEIERSGYADKLSAGIVFTGGGAMVQHLIELVQSKTGMAARIAKPANITADSPKEVRQCSYATAVGLLMKGIENEQRIALPPQMPIAEPELIPVEDIAKITRTTGKGRKKEEKEPKGPNNSGKKPIFAGMKDLFGDLWFKQDNEV